MTNEQTNFGVAKAVRSSDPDIAKKVPLFDLVDYLMATGWIKSPSKTPKISIFSLTIPELDQAIQLILPTQVGLESERRRLEDALQTLAAVEEREISAILSAIERSKNRSKTVDVQNVALASRAYPISEIAGMSTSSANKLKALGIRTTDALLEAASTAKGRKALSAKTGISEQQLLEWANVSDYMRIPGMGRAKVGLVRAAGVMTLREFALRNPARLRQNMKLANSKRKLVRVLPSERSVEELIERARKLPPKITW